MPSPEEFMNGFLRARAEEAQREVAAYQPFRRKFFDDDCSYDSRKGVVEGHESEKVVSVSPCENGFEIITNSSRPMGALLYYLRRKDDSWNIHQVKMGCNACKGVAGNNNCFVCGGTGWIDVKAMMERAKSGNFFKGTQAVVNPVS